MSGARNNYEMKILRESVCKCELCGGTRGLETHHIVPVVCGGTEEDENLIVVCRVCHAKLTPRSVLIKAGINRTKKTNELSDIIEELYQTFEQLNEDWCYDTSEYIHEVNKWMTRMTDWYQETWGNPKNKGWNKHQRGEANA